MKDIQSSLVNLVKDVLAVNQSSKEKEENTQPGNVNDTDYDSLFPILEIDKLLQFDKLMTENHDDIQQKLVSVYFFVNILKNNDIIICFSVLILRLIIGLRSSRKLLKRRNLESRLLLVSYCFQNGFIPAGSFLRQYLSLEQADLAKKKNLICKT